MKAVKLMQHRIEEDKVSIKDQAQVHHHFLSISTVFILLLKLWRSNNLFIQQKKNEAAIWINGLILHINNDTTTLNLINSCNNMKRRKSHKMFKRAIKERTSNLCSKTMSKVTPRHYLAHTKDKTIKNTLQLLWTKRTQFKATKDHYLMVIIQTVRRHSLKWTTMKRIQNKTRHLTDFTTI